MGRKRKNSNTSTDEIIEDAVSTTEETIENATEIEEEIPEVDEEEIVDEEDSDESIHIISEEIVEAIKEEIVENVIETQNPTNKLINEIETYMSEFKVSEEVAINLAQRVLGIGQTGVLDHRTLSAYDFVSNKEDFLNDYRNGRK